MSPIEGPQSHLVGSDTPPVPGREEFHARPAPTTFLVYSLGLASHLGTLGSLIETLPSHRRGVIWRAPFEAKPAARRYEATYRARNIGRERALRAKRPGVSS